MASSSSSMSLPRATSPLPMIPVPKALEAVLTETSKSLRLTLMQRQRRQERHGDDSLPLHRQLVGRISNEDIVMPPPGYPDHNSSIMDGYAVKTSDLERARAEYCAMNRKQKDRYVLDFDILGEVYAGDDCSDEDGDSKSFPHSYDLTAVYVTTGAVVPSGYDAVIPVEDTTISPAIATPQNAGMNKIRIIPSKVEYVINSIKPWTWIRTIGKDIPSGSVVLSKGEKILPVHLALIAQAGVHLGGVQVKRLPNVGVLSTGNEIVATTKLPSGKQLSHGNIPDVNRPLLLSQLSNYGNCTPVDLGIVTDDESVESIAQMINEKLWFAGDQDIDVLITTGGISMGEKDIMEEVFVQGMGGKVLFGRMNMKPGKPTTFITIDKESENGKCKKLVFALPGNPVSASVCTELLVRPCLDLLHQGADTMQVNSSMESFVEKSVNNARVHEEVMAAITADIKLDQGRPEYRRVSLQRIPSNGSGNQKYLYQATDTGVQRSSCVLSLRGADGLLMLPRGGALGCGYDIARKGMEFPVLMFSSMSLSSGTSFKDSMHRTSWKPKPNTHDVKLDQKVAVGLIICGSSKIGREDFQSIEASLAKSLGGETKVAQKAICQLPQGTKYGLFVQQLSDIVDGPQMDGADVIFVIVATNRQTKAAIAFRAGVEVSHAISPKFIKSAKALALQVRTGAVSYDPAAALFENVVGTVRDGSSVLITCSDRGLEGAVGAIKGLLGHLVSCCIPESRNYSEFC